MKKIFTLFIALAAMTICANAQVLLSEGFENGAMPSDWSTLDVDGDGFNWEMVASPSMNCHGGEGAIASASYDNDGGVALTPDNWLITPQVNLVGASTLTYWVCGQDASYAEEHYGVYISTTGTDPDNFVLMFEETINASGGAKTPGTYKQKSVNLSAFSGNVYIAFRHFNCTDMFWLNLDDVEISLGTTNVANIENNVNIYPNPANSMANVNANSNISNIEIYSISGQKVADFTVNGTQASINTSNMSTGLYLMKINTENGVINQKFAVAH